MNPTKLFRVPEVVSSQIQVVGAHFEKSVQHFASSWLITLTVLLGGFAAISPGTAMATPGDVDLTFNLTVDSAVASSAVQPDGKTIIAGCFHIISGIPRNCIARINVDGTLDKLFDPNLDNCVNNIVVQADGRILICGSFSLVGGTPRRRLARLNGNGTLDTSFDAGLINDEVNCVTVQSDGKIVIGGVFTSVGGTARKYIARLNTNGTLEASFNAVVEGSFFPKVNSLVLQADGKLVIAGSFDSVAGVARRTVARLNPSGSLDAQFNPAVFGVFPFAYCALIRADGKILIGGTDIYSSDNGINISNLFLLNTNGTLDTSFAPSFFPGQNGTVNAGTIQSDGKIVIAGSFSSVSGYAHTNLARLDANGIVDNSFNANLNNSGGGSVILEPDGKILLSGFFNSVSGVSRLHLARLQNDAATQSLTATSTSRVEWQRGGASPEAQDVIFELSSDHGSSWTALGPGDRIPTGWEKTGLSLPANGLVRGHARAIGGRFCGSGGLVGTISAFPTNAAPTVVNSIIDFSVNEDASDTVIDLRTIFMDAETAGADLVYTIQTNNTQTLLSATINNTSDLLTLDYITNSFGEATITIRATDSVGLFAETTFTVTVNRQHDGDSGDLDLAFDPAANGTIYTITSQPDGKIIVGGNFSSIAGTQRDSIARFNPDGSLDAGFNPKVSPISAAIFSTAVQADGRVIIGGIFTNVGGLTRGNLARLNSDGTVDPIFDPVTSVVFSLSIQEDGKIVVGGFFNSMGINVRNNIARLNSNGSLDNSFNPNANDQVHSTLILPSGKILIAGSFNSVDGASIIGLARLNSNGALDSTFTGSLTNGANSFAVQADGKILVATRLNFANGFLAGRFLRVNNDGTKDNSFNSNISTFINTIAVQADGRIIIGGLFSGANSMAHNYLVRLGYNGTLEDGFNPVVNDIIYGTAIQADGKIVVSGDFTQMGGLTRNFLARLVNDPATNVLTVSGTSRVEWLRGGASPEAQSVTFELSTDGAMTWALLGEATRIPGGWEKTGLSLPSNGVVRGRARLTSGQYNGSSSLVEMVAAFPAGYVPSPRLRDLTRIGNNSFQFGFYGLQGVHFTALSSTNISLPLIDWSLLGRAVEVSPGRYQFTDPSSNNDSVRFYQIRSP